jgi:hypothetical protein
MPDEERLAALERRIEKLERQIERVAAALVNQYPFRGATDMEDLSRKSRELRRLLLAYPEGNDKATEEAT